MNTYLWRGHGDKWINRSIDWIDNGLDDGWTNG